MFKLYSFDPYVLENGYKHEGTFKTEQECNDEAFKIGLWFFRIEFQNTIGSTIVFESQPNKTDILMQ